MFSTRWMMPVLAALVLVAPADGGGLFGRKGKSDFRVKQLIETLRMDPDEKKRQAAIAELRDADPRTQQDVIPALVAALRQDSAVGVRADAAAAIGHYKQVFPVAGLALESAAESDPSAAVRGAAQQTLWDYHLGGYRSARGADGIAGQTAEPPIASPPAVRPVTAISQAVATLPAPPVFVGPPLPLPPAGGLPAVSAPPPAVVTSFKPPPAGSGVMRVILTAAPPLQLNVTAEPPFAKQAEETPLRTAVAGPDESETPVPEIATAPLPELARVPTLLPPQPPAPVVGLPTIPALPPR